MKPTLLAASLALSMTSLLTACANHYGEQHKTYTPGLGEIMAQTASRHSKLWLAGQAKNWDLAAYEIDELREGFDDAGKYHPSHKHIAKPIPELIANTMEQPMTQLEQAIKTQNLLAFTENYDKLTAGCNSCHQRTHFGFNIVARPTFNPFANQLFESKH